MCKFCEGLFKEKKEIIWEMRNSYADDNFCEKILNDNCEECKMCDISYRLTGWYLNKVPYIMCSYKFNNGDILMWNSTESLPINYCPYCGEKINLDKMVDFNNIGSYVVNMIDKN